MGSLSMPKGLRRIYGQGHLHFLTFSCYRRLPLLGTKRARNLFVKTLGEVQERRYSGGARRKPGFCWWEVSTSMCGARRRGKRSWSICIGTRLPEGWWNIPGTGRGAVGRSMRGKRTGWSPSIRWSEEHGAARKSPTRRSDVWATHQPDGLIVRGGGSRPGHPPACVISASAGVSGGLHVV